MTEAVNIQLDGSEIAKGANDTLAALAQLKAAITDFSRNDPTGRVRAETQALATSAVSTIQSIEKTLGGIKSVVDRQMAAAATAGREGGRKIAKAISDGLEDQDVAATARAALKKLQAEYEATVALGFKVKESALANLKSQGVTLFPDDRVRLKAAQDAQAGYLQMLETRVRSEKGASAATLKAWEEDLSGYQLMLSMRAKSQADSAASRVAAEKAAAAATLKAWQDDLSGYQLMLNMKARSQVDSASARVTAEKAASAATLKAWQDDLSGYQLMLSMKARSQVDSASQLAAERAKQTADNLKAYEQDLAGWQHMLKLRVAAAQEAQKQISAATLATVGNSARALLNNTQPGGDASSIVRGAKFGTLIPGVKETKTDLTELQPAITRVTKDTERMREEALRAAEAKRVLAERSRDLHSAFRGLAAAGGALFLTYGSLIPLAGAFFAASSVKEAIASYKDFEYRLQFTRALTQDYTLTLSAMGKEVSETAVRMGVLPVEAAKGMQVLAQAGLSAVDSVRALPTVLALASVGEIDMSHAATTATGAMHAFGLSVDSLSRVSDVFTKAAAVSNTSVASISESMKQASSIAQEYKVSIEDVGTMLAALAKRNIVGSAGGTAIRNMFSELAAPRGEAKKVAEQLKINLFDPVNGTVNQFFDTFLPQLRKKLEVFDPQSQTYILHRLFNERGAKAMQALLGMRPEDLAKLREEVQDSTGYAMKVFIEANNTIEGELRRLKATFSSTLIEGGSGVADQTKEMLRGLREAVGSDGFQSALRGGLKAVADVVGMLAGLASVALSPTGAVAALTALGVASVAFRTGALLSIPAAHGLAAALAGVQLGSGGAAFALSGLAATFAAIARFTLVTSAILGTVYALSKLYDLMNTPTPTERIAGEYKTLSESSKDYVLQLQREITALKEKRALQTGNMAEIGEVIRSNELITKSNLDLWEAQAKANDPKRSAGNRKIWADEAARLSAENIQLKKLGDETQARLAQARKLEEERKKLQAESDARDGGTALKSGTAKFKVPDYRAANSEYRNELKEINLLISANRQKAQEMAESARFEEAVLQQSYERGVLSFTEYQDRLNAAQARHSSERIELAVAEQRKVQEELVRLRDLAKSRDPKSGPDGQLNNDIESLSQKSKEGAAALAKMANDAYLDQSKILTGMLKPSAEMVRNSEKELAAIKNNLAQEIERVRIKENINLLSEREQYIQAEVLRGTNALADKLSQVQAQLKDSLDKGVFDDLTNPDTAQAFANLLNLAGRLKSELADAGAGLRDAANEAFDAKKVGEIAKGLNTGLVDAIVDAGKDGGKGLMEMLQEELLRKPLKVVLQGLLQPLTSSVAQTLWGALTGSQTSAPGGAGLGGLLNGASNAYSLYGAASGYSNGVSTLAGLFGAGSTAGASGTSLAYANAVSGLGGDGMGALIAANGSWAGVGAGTAAGTGASFGVLAEGGTVVAGAGGGAAAGGVAGALASIPVYGWIALAAMALLSMEGGETRMGQSYTVDAAGKAFNPTDSWDRTYGNEWGRYGGPSGGPIEEKTARAAVEGASTGINKLFERLGSSVKLTGFQAGLESSDNGRGGVYAGGTLTGGLEFGESGLGSNYDGSKYETTSSTSPSAQEALANYSTDLKQAAIQALQVASGLTSRKIAEAREVTRITPELDETGNPSRITEMQTVLTPIMDAAALAAVEAASDIPKAIRDKLRGLDAEALSDEQASAVLLALETEITAVNDFRKAIELLPFENLKSLSFDAADALITAAGGMDQFGSKLAAYGEGFYSEAERNASAMNFVVEALEKANVAIPNTHKEFRALVEAQDVTTESGRKTYLALLDVAQAFDQVVSSTQSLVRNALQELSQSLQKMHDRVTAANEKFSGAKDDVADAYQQAKDRTKSAQDALNDLLKESAQAVESFAGDIRGFLSGLAAGPSAANNPAARYMRLWEELQGTATSAKGGDQDARNRLTTVAQSFLTSAESRSGSYLEYARDESRVRTLLNGVLGSLPQTPGAPQEKSLEERIAEAQEALADRQDEEADYLQLMVETGTSTEAGVWSVSGEITKLREAYDAARVEQINANANLTIALEALSSLGLSEELVNAILSGQDGSAPGDFAEALGVSDDTIEALQAAMGFTDSELEALSDALNVKVAPVIWDALAASLKPSTATLETLNISLGPRAQLMEDLAAGLGMSPIKFKELQESLGLDELEAAALKTILGASPAEVTAWKTALGVDTTQITPLATALGLNTAQTDALATAIGLTLATTDILNKAATLVGFSEDANTAIAGLATSVNFHADAVQAITDLATSADFSPEAYLAMDGLQTIAGFNAVAQKMFEDLGTKTGFSAAAMGTFEELATKVGVQGGLMDQLGYSLGLTEEARNAVDSLLSAMGHQVVSVSTAGMVQQAYASIGRTGFGTGVNQIDTTGYQYWLNQFATGGVTAGNFQSAFLSDAANWVTSRPEDPLSQYVKPYLHTLGVPGFAVGINRVPGDMLAMIHADESVVPAAYNPYNPNATRIDDGANDELVAEMRAMRQELAAAKAELRAIKESSESVDKALKKVTLGGTSLRTTAA